MNGAFALILIKPLIKAQSRRFYPLEKTDKTVLQSSVLSIILIVAVLVLVPFVSADSYQMYCLKKGEALDLPKLCNPAMDKKAGPMNICMHLLDNGKICPTTLNACNSLGISCTSGGTNSTIDEEPPVFTILSPLDDEVYNNKAVLSDISLDESSDIFWTDNNNLESGWKKICQKCIRFSQKVNFREGENNITFRFMDQSGNEAFSGLEFFVDSAKPKITKTEPTKGFANGRFSVSFQEANPFNLVLNYGNSDSGMRSANLDIGACSKEEDKHNCNVEVNLADFDEETIQYSFVLTDISDNSVESKMINLLVDNSAPRFNSVDFSIDGKSANFVIDVNEQNPDKLTYIDSSGPKAKEKTLCSGMQVNTCSKKVPFNDGEHDVVLIASDKAGHSTNISVQFFTDSKKPKITKTAPTKGFASGMFNVEFQEENPTSLVLHYGLSGEDVKNIDLSSCLPIVGGKKSCITDVILGSFDGQIIQYWFELTDRVNNSVSSKPVSLIVDITSPVINVLNYSLSGTTGAQITIGVTEQSLDKITYLNANDKSPKETTFCTSLNGGQCSKKITLNVGDNLITFSVYDKAGNAVAQNLDINI